MWVINREKENAKNHLISSITGNISNLTAYSNEVRDLASCINRTIGGLPSGTDTRLTGCCQRALNNLSQSIGLLRQSLEYARSLFIMEWVDDGD